jgi:hypothetical protein
MVGAKTPLSLTKALYRARGKFTLEVHMKKLSFGNMGMLLLASSLGLAACTPAPVDPGKGQLRIVNALRDSTGLKVYYGDKTAPESLTPVIYKAAFPSVETYSTVSVGTLKYGLCETSNDRSCSNDGQLLEVAKDEAKTVFVFGTVDKADDLNDPKRPVEIVTVSDKTDLPENGKAKVRLVYADSSATYATVDVHVTASTAVDLLVKPLNLAYKAVDAYSPVTAGKYKIRLTARGETNVLIDSGELDFVAGKIYTFVLFKDAILKLTDR